MSELADRIRSGDARALARACRLVDERAPRHRELLRELFAASGQSARLGITGSPGVGKSTVSDALIAALRAAGERVGVVAIDPSSPFSGGALLGDRIRMQRHASDVEVFIRSLATRGAQGGLSRSAADIVLLFEAWGATSVLIETVGVGQAELELLGVAHSVVLVTMPGSGDDIQANKAGIVEAADIIVLNKADRPGVEAAESELHAALALSNISLASGFATHAGAAGAARTSHQERWEPPIVRTVANRGDGIEALMTALSAHRAWLTSPAGQRVLAAREARRWLAFLRQVVADQLFSELAGVIDELVPLIVERKLDPYSAAERVLGELRR